MDVASKQQKTLKNVLYYGLPVLAILMIAVGWVLFSGSHPELMPAPADVWARFVKTFTKPIAKTSPGRTCMGQLKACTHGTAYRMGLWYFLRHSHRME